jgi:hypothetical protein
VKNKTTFLKICLFILFVFLCVHLIGQCDKQQNTPIETWIKYNYYYGTTHNHSNYSDGGYDLQNCGGGEVAGKGSYGPAKVYDYASTKGGLDFLFITDHNHMYADSIKRQKNISNVTHQEVIERYKEGMQIADEKTIDGKFIAVWGQEFGLIQSDGNPSGHIIIIDSPKLFGWKKGSSNQKYYDLYVEPNDFPSLFTLLCENPSSTINKSLGIFCHPQTGDFNDLKYNENADDSIQAIAILSGKAKSNMENCSKQNIASQSYLPKWKKALLNGYHVGPVAEPDAHCMNYGTAMPSRTVYLLSNLETPILTKINLLEAHYKRHFFCSEDSNVQLFFGTENQNHIMGDQIEASGSSKIKVTVNDPDGEKINKIEIFTKEKNKIIVKYAETKYNDIQVELAGEGSTFYFVHVIQEDGDNIWSSPIWIEFN